MAPVRRWADCLCHWGKRQPAKCKENEKSWRLYILCFHKTQSFETTPSVCRDQNVGAASCSRDRLCHAEAVGEGGSSRSGSATEMLPQRNQPDFCLSELIRSYHSIFEAILVK